jgi:hypothetical protein
MITLEFIMRITQIVQETTTSGSVATVAQPLLKGAVTRNPSIYGKQGKPGSMFKGKVTNKPFVNSISESAIKEEEISEQDLILVPGQGRKFKTGFVPHAQDRTDHEVEMALSDLFQAAKNAKEVYQIVKTYSEEEGLEGWVQEKIIKANDYLNTIREYLEHRQLTKEGMKGAMVGGAAGAAITKTPMGSLKGASLGSDIEDMFKEAIHGAGVIGNGMAGESANHQVEGGPMTKAMDTLSEILNAADEQKDIRVKIGNKIGPISKEYANTIKLLFSRANAVGKGDRFVKLFTSVPSFVELITNPQFKKAHIQANIKKASPEGFRGTAIYKHMDKATSGVEEKPKFDIVAEKAVSKAQQKFMGIVHAAQKGEKRQALMKQKKEIEAQLKQDAAHERKRSLQATRDFNRSRSSGMMEQGVAEGASELLKKEMPLHRHAEKLLAQKGVSKDDPDYHHHLGNTIKHLRQFGNIDLINKQDVAEGSGKNVVKSIKVGNFRHDLVDTGMGWQVRIYNGDELYDTGMSKNSEQKGLAALEDAVVYTEKQTRTKRQGVAEGSDYTPPELGTVKANLMLSQKPTVQVQVFKHNTLRGDSYWVTKEVRTFKTMDQAQAYVDRINKQGMAESSEEKEECGNCYGSGRMVWDAEIGTDQECFVCDGTGEVDWDDDEKDDVKEGADIEYVVVIRDDQGKRSIRISALTPTDAKEKAESQGYKVIKVKDPSDSHYFNFKEGSVTSNFKIGPKSEYDKGKADSYYRRGDRSDQSSDPKEYLRGYDENDAYKDWGRDNPVDEGSSNILKGISRMVKGKPTPGAEYQKYFDAYKKAMQTGDKTEIANATRDLKRIEKVAGPAFFEGLGLPFPGTYEQERGLESTDEKLDEKWSDKYKRSIDCSHPKGFSQRAHCQGKKKK